MYFCEGDSFDLFEKGGESELPRVSQCFQETVLLLIPALFLLLFCPLLLCSFRRSVKSPLIFKPPTTLKIYICIFLVLNVIVRLGHAFTVHLFFVQMVPSNPTRPLARFVCLSLSALSTILALFLLISCKKRGLVTSGVLFNYWLLLSVCGAPQFAWEIGQIFEKHTQKHYITMFLFISYYLAVLMELFLSSYADTQTDQSFDKKECPEGRVSFLNRITFWWFNGMARLGNKRPLEADDLWNLLKQDRSEYLLERFEKIRTKQLKRNNERYSQQKHAKVTLLPSDGMVETELLQMDGAGSKSIMEDKKKTAPNGRGSPSIIWPLFLTFKWPTLRAAFCKLIYDLLHFVLPFFLSQLIAFTEDHTMPTWRGIAIALSMLTVSLIQSMFLHQYFHTMFRLGMNVKSVLASTVYRKAILLSNESRKNRTIGEIVNLMSVDIQRFQDMTPYVMLFWSAPLQVVLALFFLWKLLGISVATGLITLVTVGFLNTKLAVTMRSYQQKQMVLKDERLKLLNEMLNGIKILKLYAWEGSIEKRILCIRKKEAQILKHLCFLLALMSLTWACAPFLVAVSTFATYLIIDPEHNILTPQITFVAISLFNILRFPLASFSMIGSPAIQTAVSNRRLKSFLAEEEIEPLLRDTQNSKISICIKNADFAWEKNQSLLLKKINLSVRKGTLLAIVGQTGSGKSSILSAMLGEMYRHSGENSLDGNVAYVPQQAWIQNMTLKNNILFSHDFDADKYERVIDVCALEQDLVALPAGDQTEIGEKRVSLARAAYADADIYLLDDPLSAVDVHVGAHLFDKLIGSANGLLRGKTRVLVTHSLAFLKHCDQIVVVKDGSITQMGTYTDLLEASGEFSDLIRDFLTTRSSVNSDGLMDKDVQEFLSSIKSKDPEKSKELERQLSQKATLSSSSKTTESEPIAPDPEKTAELTKSTSKKNGPKPSQNKKLIEREEVFTGKVKYSVYMDYLRAIGLWTCLLCLLIYLFSSVLGVACLLWLAKWSDHASEFKTANGSISSSNIINLSIYTGLGLGQASFLAIGAVIMSLGMVYAGYAMHERMLRSILRSPISFFDVTPLGRILNRFSKDVDNLDSAIPRSLSSFIQTVFASMQTLVTIVYATPQFVFVLAPLAVIYGFVLRYYVSTSRQLKRLESISRSPIYSHFQESVQGASSIRAYNSIGRFLRESQQRVDYNFVAYYPSIIANRWLAIRLELVGNSIVFFSALFAVLFRDSEHLTAGLVGLSISYALGVTQTLNWVVRMASDVETNIVSVERIKEYIETPNEANLDTPSELNLSENWPEKGDILMEDVSLRYRPELDTVLNGISAHINPREKIGIVGRTGAGKSSLTIALFRLTELSSGRIIIDAVDISELGLFDLRSRLTIVPQDPVLFSGTLRFNLDPFDHLCNISLGQRQLLCLTRALLRSSRILILDEATASVDMATDALVQETIRREFRDCTVLTIAHRLETILDSNRVMVLQQGRVKEFDSSKSLMNDPRSELSAMVANAKMSVSQQNA
uniref:ABC-type glutathione-S-conjugate transporter n=1 Tax=Globodera rostochiensis TaxID=31243 RepID=A0A914IDL3_GLORO